MILRSHEGDRHIEITLEVGSIKYRPRGHRTERRQH